MNFDFSDDLKQVRDEARAFLSSRASSSARSAIESGTGFDAGLWAELGRLGWIGAAIPEEYGGSGLGDEGLCILAEEIGRANAAVPFASSAYLASSAILRFGSGQQKQTYLPKLATGELIGCLAYAEGPGMPRFDGYSTTFAANRLTGAKHPVADGGIAHLAVVATAAGLVLTELTNAAVTRTPLKTVDPSRDAARLVWTDAHAEPLPGAQGASAWGELLDRAAILFAFEQIGGAEACLDMARRYALERHAFGRPIGSFQAIKHKLADVYVAIELARSNAYYGAWALSANAPDLTSAASAARVASIAAYELASAENIQTHGGMGFTWDSDCHLFYRRAKHLSLAIGAAPFWKDRLIGAIERRNAA